MSASSVHYRVVGQDDYMLDILLDASGSYRIDCGDHTSHTPRQGRLSEAQAAELQRLATALGDPVAHEPPEGASGFVAELTIGDPPNTRVHRFWEGALEDDRNLHALVRALEVI